jgi:NitT/TauT family transport system ATP-binding protein
MVQGEITDLDMLISAKHVGKTYVTITGERIQAIRNISLELFEGEVLAIVGTSGCGKSTLLRLISGVETPSEGTIRRSEGRSFVVGFIFQDPSLMRWRTIYDNIRLPLEVVRRKVDEKKIAEVIKLVNLKGFENAYPMELSGGMQHRTAIARALVHEPNVLLMDEPLTGVDEITKEILQSELSYIIRELKVASVLVTHDVPEAVLLADRVLVMSSQPGTIIDEVKVHLPEIRDPAVKADPRFTECCMTIRERLNILHPLRKSSVQYPSLPSLKAK